jgi:hypothetical protein
MLVYYPHIYKLYLGKRLKIEKFHLVTFSSGSQKMQDELWAYKLCSFFFPHACVCSDKVCPQKECYSSTPKMTQKKS